MGTSGPCWVLMYSPAGSSQPAITPSQSGRSRRNFPKTLLTTPKGGSRGPVHLSWQERETLGGIISETQNEGAFVIHIRFLCQMLAATLRGWAESKREASQLLCWKLHHRNSQAWGRVEHSDAGLQGPERSSWLLSILICSAGTLGPRLNPWGRRQVMLGLA